jgi:hypothetical protein
MGEDLLGSNTHGGPNDQVRVHFTKVLGLRCSAERLQEAKGDWAPRQEDRSWCDGQVNRDPLLVLQTVI